MLQGFSGNKLKMPFKKDFNKLFMLMILVNMFLLSTVIIFYEYKINNLLNGYDVQKQEFEQTTARVVLSQINNTMKLKDAAQQDRNSFEKKYYALVKENENLKAQNENIWKDLSILQKKFRENQSLSTS